MSTQKKVVMGDAQTTTFTAFECAIDRDNWPGFKKVLDDTASDNDGHIAGIHDACDQYLSLSAFVDCDDAANIDFNLLAALMVGYWVVQLLEGTER